MDGTLSEKKKQRMWEEREVVRKRVIRSVTRILNQATLADYEEILRLLEQESFVAQNVMNASVVNVEKALPGLVNAERRMTRFAIAQFNSLSTYPDVEFTQYLRRLTDRVVTDNLNIMNGTTREKTGLMLLELDSAPEEAREVIREKYLKDRYNRADVMSWTTTTQVANETDFNIYQNSEFVDEHQWFTQGDDRVRPTHMQVNGAVVKVGENFPVVDIPYPSQYRCRCGTRPKFKDPDQVIDEFLAVSGEG